MNLPWEMPTRRVEKALKRFGFCFARQTASHQILKKEGFPLTITLTARVTLRPVMRRELRKVGISVKDFLEDY